KCSSTLPTNPTYFANEILFDNILTGDYQTVDNTDGSNYSGGNPLVHIRAVPEGGTSASKTNLPFTFYSRFNGANVDRRQPLPATFAARWIQGGSTSFSTSFKIWREGRTGPVTCATPPSSNGFIAITEIVRFDEHENPMTFNPGIILCTSVPATIVTPPTSRAEVSSGMFPPLNSPAGDTAGWMYFNLNSGTTTGGVNTQLHPTFGSRPSQNWVVVSMSGAGSTSGLFGVEYDATYLGNGCAPAIAMTNGGITAGVGPGILVCPKFDPAC